MATTAADQVFVDTNVLVYSALRLSPLHTAAVGKLQTLRQQGAVLRVSRQVLREYIATMSRPLTVTPSVPMATLIADVVTYQSSFQVADETPAVTARLLAVLAAFPIAGKQVHDANVVATMQACGILRLLTHNTADFARFGSVITIDPLVP